MELLVDPPAEIVLGEPLVVEDGAELVDEHVVDLVAQLVQDGVAALGDRSSAWGLLHLVEPLVERHRSSLEFLLVGLVRPTGARPGRR